MDLSKEKMDILREVVENAINSQNEIGSYNEAWCDGYRYMASSIFDIRWNDKTEHWEVN